MSGKAAVDALRGTGNRQLDTFAQQVKQNLDSLTGQNKNAAPLNALPPDATLGQVIEQLNRILERLN